MKECERRGESERVEKGGEGRQEKRERERLEVKEKGGECE